VTECCIGLGANLGDPRRSLRDAVDSLADVAGITLLRTSRVYRSAPLGPAGQPDYLNAAVAIDTRLAPPALLAVLQDLEARAGRVRGERWGPRTLDLDLLLFGSTQIASEELTVPHPRIRERNFVLEPLLDLLGPDYRLGGRSLRYWLRRAPANALEVTPLDLAGAREQPA
jgi:2-amino-4-hydroxy-6-hydroxymethyldihydropteridine diphosphokinase